MQWLSHPESSREVIKSTNHQSTWGLHAAASKRPPQSVDAPLAGKARLRPRAQFSDIFFYKQKTLGLLKNYHCMMGPYASKKYTNLGTKQSTCFKNFLGSTPLMAVFVMCNADTIKAWPSDAKLKYP